MTIVTIESSYRMYCQLFRALFYLSYIPAPYYRMFAFMSNGIMHKSWGKYHSEVCPIWADSNRLKVIVSTDPFGMFGSNYSDTLANPVPALPSYYITPYSWPFPVHHLLQAIEHNFKHNTIRLTDQRVPSAWEMISSTRNLCQIRRVVIV